MKLKQLFWFAWDKHFCKRLLKQLFVVRNRNTFEAAQVNIKACPFGFFAIENCIWSIDFGSKAGSFGESIGT